MPYIAGSTSHGVVHVADVFHSPNVFANNVPVALHLAPGGTTSFANTAVDPPIAISTAAQAVYDARTAAYIANPSASYNATAAAMGVKGDYQEPPDVAAAEGQPPSTAAASDLIPYLTQVLNEANRGMWRETGQGGAASNPNITGIWTSLGFPASGCWTTDQTAWCAGFVNFALKKCGYRYVQTASAKAIAQTPAKWNATSVPIDQGQPGDIVLWSFSHVNFIYTAQAGKYTFVGGNQTPSSGKNNNPSDGDVTISWPSGWTPSRGNVASIWRPSKT